MKQRICHLIDDTNPGGVMRFLDFIEHSKTMTTRADHQELIVKRGTLSAPSINADVIVSHLTVCWQNLAFFLTLRSANPTTPIVHFEHSYTLGFFTSYVSSPTRFKALLRTAYALFDQVIAVSYAQARWLHGSSLVPSRKLAIIKPCVDLSEFLALKPSVQNPIKNIGAVGRLNSIKGFDILVSAFKTTNFDEIDLHIYGEGAERPLLENLAGDANNIHFHGHITDASSIMEAVDAVAVPSHYEAYGLVALEARAAGRPLLVSGIDGLQDHVDNGANKVHEQTIEAWVDALKNMIAAPDKDRVLRSRKIAADAQKRFHENWQSLMKTMEQI